MSHPCFRDYGVVRSDPIRHFRWCLWLLGCNFTMHTALVCSLGKIYTPCDALCTKRQSDNHQQKMSSTTRQLYVISTDNYQNIMSLRESNTISLYSSLHCSAQDTWVYRLRCKWNQYTQCMNKKHFKWLANTYKCVGVNQNQLTAFCELLLNFRIDFLIYVYDECLWRAIISTVTIGITSVLEMHLLVSK